MGFMPGIFSRDKYFRRFDVLLNRHPWECLQALRRIESGEDPDDRSVCQIVVDVDRTLVPDSQEPDPYGRELDAKAIERINAYWYGDSNSYYFNIDVKKYTPEVRRRIARLTFIRALEVANGQRKIRTHYCCVGDHFEGVVNLTDPEDGVVQVVLMTGVLRENLTPPALEFNDFEDIWITGLNERVQLTRDRTPLGHEKTRPLTVSPHWTPTTDVVYAPVAKDGDPILGTVRPRRES